MSTITREHEKTNYTYHYRHYYNINNIKNLVKYLVILKSHFLAFLLSWRWQVLNLRSSNVSALMDIPNNYTNLYCIIILT